VKRSTPHFCAVQWKGESYELFHWEKLTGYPEQREKTFEIFLGGATAEKSQYRGKKRVVRARQKNKCWSLRRSWLKSQL